MSKSKKSSKLARIPQPIKVKKEKIEEDRAIHSMAYYVDDRLELVKQIFGSLKTKTITNLAPEYLKEKEMEEIQELCLNELLCLSKKRLLSIINATKCPTDTESSDEDSDVEAKEEHVSLEEISSDSEIENGGGGKTSKKAGSHARHKKDAKKGKQADDKAAPPGQMSVLELLELQARARAIRSQLALEPVTKIEVDSDEESEEKQVKQAASDSKEKKKSSQTSKKSHSKRSDKSTPSAKGKTVNSNSSTAKQVLAPKALNETSTDDGAAETQISKQKIKIKRNFRNGGRTENTETVALESKGNKTNECVEKEQPSTSQEVKKEKRSLTPDVIPIVADPEVLSISDSSSAEENDNKAVEESVGNQPISTPIIQETEDGEIVETDLPIESTTAELQITENFQVQREVREKSLENNVKVNNVNIKPTISQKNEPRAHDAIVSNTETSKNKNGETDQVADLALNSPATVEKPAPTLQSPALNDNDGDHSDDVISIEGGDLENEMSEHLDEDASSKHSGQSAAPPAGNSNDIDTVSLDSSENEDETTERDSESWQSRYMRSSKVHKVLAVSRLGKRVRDKLKTSKCSKKDSNFDKSSNEERAMSSKYISKHEDGSIDQYKELIQMSQRKS